MSFNRRLELPTPEPVRESFPSRQTFRRAHLKWRKRTASAERALTIANRRAR